MVLLHTKTSRSTTPRPASVVLLLCLSLCLASWFLRGTHGATLRAKATSATALHARDTAELQNLMRRQRKLASEAVPSDHLTDNVKGVVPGIQLLWKGASYSTYDRPVPDLVESTLLKQFEDYFNQTQDFSAQGPNTYQPKGQQVVVSISGGRVSGVLGEVRDSQGQLLPDFSVRSDAGASISDAQASTAASCKRFKRLATAVQKYGHMYHHFVLEVLPRVILLKPFLDADTKLLLFGSAHEAKWLEALGIPASQVEVYDPSVQYCADELLVPSVSPIITPPRENFELLQASFQADQSSRDDESHDLIIYCSRSDAHERVVANEVALLAVIRQRFPDSELYVYTGTESVAQTVRLFRRASVVVGMHGAGLSHLVFAPRGAAVVEFLFMPDPPLMFWHAAASLQLRYIMVPLPQSWWLEKRVVVNTQDVVDALALAQGLPAGECPLGRYWSSALDQCLTCPPGTYRPAGATSCLPCASGRQSSEGSAFCSTCPAGTYSDESGFTCLVCPDQGATLFPGSFSVSQCSTEKGIEMQMKALFNRDVLANKLVSLPALEDNKPHSAVQWIANQMSPQHWIDRLRRRQLKQQYLDELFDTDLHMDSVQADEEDDADATSSRRMLTTSGYHRSMLASGYRRALLTSGYRRTLFASGYRRTLLSSGYRRTLLTSGYRRRHLLGYH